MRGKSFRLAASWPPLRVQFRPIRSLPLRSSSPPSLFFSEKKTHPPIAASSTASDRRQASSVACGKGSPAASIAAPPISAVSKRKSTPSASPAAWRTSMATAEISGPMPSPGRTQTRRAAWTETARRPGVAVAEFGVDDARWTTTGIRRGAPLADPAAAPPALTVTAAAERMVVKKLRALLDRNSG